MKRWLLVPALALVAVSCQDLNESAMGPEESTSSPLFSHTGAAGTCLDLADHPPVDENGYDAGATPQQSPCDGRLPAGFTGTEGFLFLSPTTGSPSITETFQPGLASFLSVTAENIYCPDDTSPGCDDLVELPAVTEDADSYGTFWKTRKKNDVQPESAWRVKVSVVAGSESILLGYRDYVWSNDPSQDQPSDDPVKVVQLGSNENINFFVGDGLNTCPTTGAISLTCLIGDLGQTLTVTGPLPGQEGRLIIGPDNGLNVYTLEWTDPCDETLGIDTPPLSCVIRAESQTLAADAILKDSSIEICDPYPSVVIEGLAKVYVAKSDDKALTALPWLAVNDCPDPSAGLASGSGIEALMRSGLTRLASLFSAQPLIATSLVAGTSGGGRLRDLSDFQLTALPEADFVGSGGSVRAGDPVTATVAVNSRLDAAVPLPNTTIWFYPDANGVLTCSAGAECVTNATIASGALGVVTGDDGLAVVDWVPGGDGQRTLTAVSCGTAVDGSHTPTNNPTGFILGNLTPDGSAPGCDRDPTDPVDGTAGYANGTIADERDPFEPYHEASDVNGDGYTDYEVALNDLPTTYTVSICAAPVVDGQKDASWDECSTGNEDFAVNLPGGGSGSGPLASFRWLTAPDPSDGIDYLYLSVELPRTSDESGTSLWFEFDSGAGCQPAEVGVCPDNAADELDDLIGVQRTKGVAVPSDRFLDATCASSNGSSVCNAIDSTPHVTADVKGPGVGSNGAFLFYEVRHPLCTSGETEDFCLSSGDVVGMFLRLAVGNGAQGKTIWPAFRDYFEMAIE